jgi:hypothetical protein
MLFLSDTLVVSVHDTGPIAALIMLRSTNDFNFDPTFRLLMNTFLHPERCFLFPKKLVTPVVLDHGVIPMRSFISVKMFVIDKVLVVFDD